MPAPLVIERLLTCPYKHDERDSITRLRHLFDMAREDERWLNALYQPSPWLRQNQWGALLDKYAPNPAIAEQIYQWLRKETA